MKYALKYMRMMWTNLAICDQVCITPGLIFILPLESGGMATWKVYFTVDDL